MENFDIAVLTEYIVNEALILIPVLYIVGYIIKSTEKIVDKYIPLILLAVGIIAAGFMLGWNADSIIQGVLVAGATVFINQIPKQIKYK